MSEMTATLPTLAFGELCVIPNEGCQRHDCGNPLTGRQKRWCSTECRDWFYENHRWTQAREVAMPAPNGAVSGAAPGPKRSTTSSSDEAHRWLSTPACTTRSTSGRCAMSATGREPPGTAPLGSRGRSEWRAGWGCGWAMSDLTAFRDHCQRMATAARTGTKAVAYANRQQGNVPMLVSSEDADLWDLLAGQVDAYLAGDPAIVQNTHSTDDQPLDLEAPA